VRLHEGDDGGGIDATGKKRSEGHIGNHFVADGVAKELIELGSYYVAASYTTEHITIYLARGLRSSQLPGDIDESITVERMPLRQAVHMALTNQIDDSKTLIGLVWAANALGVLCEG
jgi:hypothetical protein